MKKYKLVRCPRCYNYFITSAKRQVRCIYCGKTFQLYPARGKPRVIKESMFADELVGILERLRSLKIFRVREWDEDHL